VQNAEDLVEARMMMAFCPPLGMLGNAFLGHHLSINSLQLMLFCFACFSMPIAHAVQLISLLTPA